MKMKCIRVQVLFISALLLCEESWAQSSTVNRLSLGAGLNHISLLDEQASPLLYRGTGPAFSLAYERYQPNHQWQFHLNAGMLAMEPAESKLQFEDPYLSATSGGIHISHLRLVKKKEKISWWLGASLNGDLLVDLNEEIGNWPYVFTQGGLYANSQWDYLHNSKNRFVISVAIPIVAVVTDLPFHQIPRVKEQAPDVGSLFKVGTRVPFWNTYQLLLIDLMYELAATTKWKVNGCYRWSWTHDSEPRDLWAKHGIFSLKLVRAW